MFPPADEPARIGASASGFIRAEKGAGRDDNALFRSPARTSVNNCIN
jgi:hypothetical protein